MKQNRERLKELVTTLRTYGRKMLNGLTSSESSWVPEGTKGRSIKSYLRHIVNAELYWLNHLGYDTPDYLSREMSFNEILENYNQCELLIKNYLDQATVEELKPRTPSDSGGATIAWAVWRTSLHSIHHFAQIAYLRYTLENPPDPKSVDAQWGEIMDKIIFLGYNRF
jgi:uncharacterized damage-inducible protein DinB